MNDCCTTTFEYDDTKYLWLTYKAKNGQIWYIVSDYMRREYYLFKGKKQTRYKSDSPLSLYKYIKEE